MAHLCRFLFRNFSVSGLFLDGSLFFFGHFILQLTISGESDFVAVAKHARREGIGFIFDPMGSQINAELAEYIDGLKSHHRDLYKR